MILLWCFSLSHTKPDVLTSRGSENLLVCACICKYLETLMVTKPGQPPPEWTTFPGIPEDSRNKVSNLCPKRNPLWKKYQNLWNLDPSSPCQWMRICFWATRHLHQTLFPNFGSMHFCFPSCHRFPKTKLHNSRHRHRVQLHAIAGCFYKHLRGVGQIFQLVNPDSERSLALGC